MPKIHYTVYYAHCLAIYGTPQEDRDVATLEEMGFEVLNPNCAQIQHAVNELKRQGTQDYMAYFQELVRRADILAFRALPDGAIPAGVAKEIGFAQDAGLPIIELPSAIRRRTIDVEMTREYLKEIGQR